MGAPSLQPRRSHQGQDKSTRAMADESSPLHLCAFQARPQIDPVQTQTLQLNYKSSDFILVVWGGGDKRGYLEPAPRGHTCLPPPSSSPVSEAPPLPPPPPAAAFEEEELPAAPLRLLLDLEDMAGTGCLSRVDLEKGSGPPPPLTDGESRERAGKYLPVVSSAQTRFGPPPEGR